MLVELFVEDQPVASLERRYDGSLVKAYWSKDILSESEDPYILKELEKVIDFPDTIVHLNGKKLTWLCYVINENNGHYDH